MQTKHIIFLLTTALSVTTGAFIASASDPRASQTVLERSFSGDPKGFKLGTMTVTPILLNTVEYTSNVFRSEDDETDDRIFKTRLNILAYSNQGRSATTLNLQGDYWMYQDTDDLNRGSYMGLLYHRHDISPVASVGFRAEAEKDYQTSYDAATSQVLHEPIEVDRYGVGFDFNLNPGSVLWKFATNFDDYSYDDTTLLDSSDILVQSDRDKQVYDLSLSANFEKASKFSDQGLTPYIGLRYKRENFDRLAYETGTGDFTGVDRSNDDYDFFAGLHLRPTGKLRGTIEGGIGYYDPDDSSTDSETTSIVDIDLTYLYTPLTNFIFSAQRFFNTDTDNSEVAIQTELSAEVIHELTRMWILKGDVTYTDRDFDNAGNDELWNAAVGFRHHINDRFSLDGSVRFFTRDAENLSSDFDETRTMLRLRTKL